MQVRGAGQGSEEPSVLDLAHLRTRHLAPDVCRKAGGVATGNGLGDGAESSQRSTGPDQGSEWAPATQVHLSESSVSDTGIPVGVQCLSTRHGIVKEPLIHPHMPT